MGESEWLALYRELTQIDNVVGIGRGNKWVRGENTGKPATVVLVRKKYPKDDLRRAAVLPRQIGGRLTDVIEVGDIRLLGAGRTEGVRPAQPGVSIGHYQVSAGTFGAVVKDRVTGEKLILSNNHVLANLTDGSDERAKVGDPVLQPGVYDGGDSKASVIGHLARYIPLYRESVIPKCQIANLFAAIINKAIKMFQPHYRVSVMRDSEKVNMVDCAVATPISPEAITGEIMEIGTLAGIKESQVGLAVKKSGRSSGLTYSIILAVGVTLRVGVSPGVYGVFGDQVLAAPMSMPGDSGSLVISEDNHAVGLLFAGSEQATMFSPIGRVLDALNVTLVY